MKSKVLLAISCLLPVAACCGTLVLQKDYFEDHISVAASEAYVEGYREGYAKGEENGHAVGYNEAMRDMQTGGAASKSAPVRSASGTADADPAEKDYVINTNTGKFHKTSCASVQSIKDKNRSDRTCTRDALIAAGYEPCQRCDP